MLGIAYQNPQQLRRRPTLARNVRSTESIVVPAKELGCEVPLDPARLADVAARRQHAVLDGDLKALGRRAPLAVRIL